MIIDWKYLIAVFVLLGAFGVIWHWREPEQDRNERDMLRMIERGSYEFKCEACKRGKGRCRVHSYGPKR